MTAPVSKETLEKLQAHGFAKPKRENNYSQRELARRALISAYNKGQINELRLESELQLLFRPAKHHTNASHVLTTKDLREWIAKRSKAYRHYLKENY
jgi:hypothetical protein